MSARPARRQQSLQLNKRTFLRGALVIGATLAAPTARSTQRIRYGGDVAFPPFESLDSQGRPQGFQIELLAALGRELDMDFEIELRPWAQTESAFRQGQLDLVAMVDTDQRRQWALFTRGHATPALAFYQRQGRAELQGLEDLAGLRIAVLDHDAMRGTLATWLASVPGPFLQEPDAAQALAAVQQGRADVALLPRAYADPLLAQPQHRGLVASRLSVNLQTYSLAVAPGRTDLQAQLQRGLDALEQDGRLEALRLRWLSSHRDLAQRQSLEHGLARQQVRSWALAAVGSVVALAMGWGIRRRGLRIAAESRRRRNAEQALKRAESLLQRSFAANPEPMLVIDRQGGVVRDANAAFQALLGLSADNLIGRTLDSLGQHVDAAALQQLVLSLDDVGALDAEPLRLRRADGQARDCLVTADVLRADDAVHVFCVVRDVTDLLDQDAALRAGYDALAAQLAQTRQKMAAACQGQARAEGSLQAFTRAVSHDLKTPLNAVLGFSGLLQDRLRQGRLQEAQDFAERIASAARRMEVMINALASLAQVSRQALQRRPVHMHQLAQDSWDLLVAAHPDRLADFRLHGLSDVQADPDLVAQVWQNLLDNACKYSTRSAQPRVSVDSYQDARGRWYRVTDNGAGFDMAHAGSLFQPFHRMHASSQFEGTGVGLSLVRRIIDHHGGEIRLRSALGVGTVAEFTLDPAPPAP